MREIHQLPGTTFSSPAERGRYDSEKMAALALPELEKWLVLAVASYHGSRHGTLGQTSAAAWAAGIAATGIPAITANQTAFLVDFLPVIRRTLTRTGFLIDHVHYFANALKPWISRRDRLGKFIIRRDPRDISRIWVLEPDGHNYVEVPYRSISNPSISIWEHRQSSDPITRTRRSPSGRSNLVPDDRANAASQRDCRENDQTPAAGNRTPQTGQRPTPPRHPIHTNPTCTGCAGRRRVGKGRRSSL